MNSRQPRVERQHLLVFLQRLIPLALHLQRLGVQFMRLGGIGIAHSQLLGSMSGQVRIGMDGRVEDLRIFGEVAHQGAQKVFGGIKLVFHHSAMHPGKTGIAAKIFVLTGRHRFFQQRYGFTASARLGETKRVLGSCR